MRIGLQTVSWGPILSDVREIIQAASHIGFDGIEFSQTPESLGDIATISHMLRDNDLELISLAGGSLSRRVAYSGDTKLPYFYCDTWDEHVIEQTIKHGGIIGLHPHYYKNMETLDNVQQLLDLENGIGLIFDTAHLYLAGENIQRAVKLYYDSLVSVHLKDWTPIFGRSPYHFSLGFTELGRGVIKYQISEVVKYLRDRQFSGWLVIEQDTAYDNNPTGNATASFKWLQTILQESAAQMQIGHGL